MKLKFKGKNIMKRKVGNQKRTNQHWTNKELQRLLALSEGGVKYTEIAKTLGRSEKAVQLKLNKLIRDISKPKKTIVTVSQDAVDKWDKLMTCLDKDEQKSADKSKNLLDRAINRMRMHKWLYRLAWFAAITAAVLVALLLERLMQ
jgi:predicted transcriptional regulator